MPVAAVEDESADETHAEAGAAEAPNPSRAAINAAIDELVELRNLLRAHKK
jgi:hypothetical protein